MVFYLDDADLSVRVLGGEDAVTLHPDSGMLVRIGGRARLFQTTRTELADEDLRELLAAMGAAGPPPIVAGAAPVTEHASGQVDDGMQVVPTGSPAQGPGTTLPALSQQDAEDRDVVASAGGVVAVESATSQDVLLPSLTIPFRSPRPRSCRRRTSLVC